MLLPNRMQLKQEYGFISANEAQRHEETLGVRSFHATHASAIATQLMDCDSHQTALDSCATTGGARTRVARPSSLAPGLRLLLNLVATSHGQHDPDLILRWCNRFQ